MKTFFELKAPYEGLRVRRLKVSGRIWLVQVFNDPPPYWFVMIKGFEVRPKGRDHLLVELGLVHPDTQVGNWRFTSRSAAKAKFEQLSALPLYQAEEEKAKRARRETSERMKRLVDTGKSALARQTVVKISTGDQETASGDHADPQILPPLASG